MLSDTTVMDKERNAKRMMARTARKPSTGALLGKPKTPKNMMMLNAEKTAATTANDNEEMREGGFFGGSINADWEGMLIMKNIGSRQLLV